MKNIDQMKLFMEPESIALIGVSRSSEGGFFNPLGHLLNYGYKGKIYPVNPSAEKIQGIKAYPSIKKLPDDVDLTVILTPRNKVPGVVKECVDKGLKSLIVVAQGFADSDEEGKAMQAEIVQTARQKGARIIGPNTFGVTNAFINMCTALPRFKLEKNPIGIISQTGIAFLGTSKFYYGKVIDIGDTCDVDVADSLEYFEDDPQIKVIIIQVEAINNGQKFVQIAARITKKKPVLALKAGTSEAGAKAAQSHTGSITGTDQVYESVFKQSGVIRIKDLEEMEDLAHAFAWLPPMKGNGVAVLSWSGATGILAVDACETHGLAVPRLSNSAIKQISKLSPPDWLPIDNPVDLWACVGLSGFDIKNFKKGFKLILQTLLDEQKVDGVVIIIPDFLQLFFSEHWDISTVILELSRVYTDKPVVFNFIGEVGELAVKLKNDKKAGVFPSCERSVRALARLYEYYCK